METYLVLFLLAGIVAMDTTSGPQILLSEPLVSCSALGLLFGNPETGLMLGTFFQLVLLVSDSVSAVQNEFLETSYTLGISKWLTVWKVLVPASFPSIFNNLRVCMGWAWSYLVVAELVAASKGIGFMIIKSQRFLQTGNVISGIIIVGILGLIFDYIFKLAYNILFPWAQKRVA